MIIICQLSLPLILLPFHLLPSPAMLVVGLTRRNRISREACSTLKDDVNDVVISDSTTALLGRQLPSQEKEPEE
jgi:hypothetical protein